MNQNNYLPALRLALKESAAHGVLWKPQKLFDVLAEQENPIEFVSKGGWDCNQLFQLLDEDLNFVQRARFGYKITEDEQIRLTNILRWFRVEIEYFDFDDEMTLAVLLLVAVKLSDGRLLWREISFRKCPVRFIEKIVWLFSRFAITFSMRGEHPPLWEAEAMAAFVEANRAGNFIHIETTWSQISGALIPSAIQQTAAMCLSYHDSPKLLEVSHKIKDVVIAAHAMDALSTEKMLLLAKQSRSMWVKFGALLALCHGRARRLLNRLNKRNQKHLTDLLVSIAEDKTYWHQFVVAFNRYPSRYPVLHRSIGRALACLTASHWEQYFSSFEATDSGARPSVSLCLESFYTVANNEASA